MGSEAACTVQYNGQRSDGKALLETEQLIFRGGFRLAIPRSSITALEATDGRLHVTYADGTAVFELGPNAAKWAEKLRNPRSRLDKLGVKAGQRIAVVGIDDDQFLSELAERVPDVARRAASRRMDLIFFAAESPADLGRLARLRESLVENGAIWIVHRKGKGATLRDVDVFAAAKRAGLVDNKVASFSATHTAERLVIPLAQRTSAKSR